MVAGDNGLILVTDEVLTQYNYTHKDLESFKSIFGVNHWLVFSGFDKEMTGHADVHIRILNKNLFAVAWNLSSEHDQAICRQLIDQFQPNAEILQVPIRSSGEDYGSLLNWLQIGQRIIFPRYDITPEEDILKTMEMLMQHGFKSEFIYSPTLEYGGSLHCLTASIYA